MFVSPKNRNGRITTNDPVAVGRRTPVCTALKVSAFLALMFSQSIFAQGIAECGSLDNMYGPFDYTNNDHFQNRLPVVESHHFTPEVESFQGHIGCGGNGCKVAIDIDYTLRAFPNHHRALMAMARYHLRGLDRTERKMRYSAACYFDRALRHTPKDPMVRMIFGYFLSKTGEINEALKEYEAAISIAPNSAEAHYNTGLLYVDLKNYPRARKHAQTAYELGFPLPGLRRKLERVGEWRAPETTGAVSNPE